MFQFRNWKQYTIFAYPYLKKGNPFTTEQMGRIKIHHEFLNKLFLKFTSRSKEQWWKLGHDYSLDIDANERALNQMKLIMGFSMLTGKLVNSILEFLMKT